MTPADRAIVAAAEEREELRAADTLADALRDRRELLRIVRAQERELADRADAAAAERATSGKWGG